MLNQHHQYTAQHHTLSQHRPLGHHPVNTSNDEVPVLNTPDPTSTVEGAATKRVPDTMGLAKASVKLVKCEERVRLLVKMRQMRVTLNHVKSVVNNIEKLLGKDYVWVSPGLDIWTRGFPFWKSTPPAQVCLLSTHDVI